MIIHAPASSEYYSLDADEPYVLNMGASYFRRRVLSTDDDTRHWRYPSHIFPPFLAIMFEYCRWSVTRFIAGLKNVVTVDEDSGKCPEHVGKMAVS
jgi:hypothetical protein